MRRRRASSCGTIATTQSAPLGQIVSLKLDDDRPHLAYSVISDKGELDGTVWYATRE